MSSLLKTKLALSLLLLLLCDISYAFEDTRVLPKGVRRLNITAISTRITEKTDNSGDKVSVIDRLNKKVDFKLLASTQAGMRGTSIRAFLPEVGASNQDSAGSFLADAGLDLAGYGVQLNYGMTDNITLGVGLPVYKASVRMSMGFQMSDASRDLAALLTKPAYNQVEAARQVITKLNNPGPVLNQLLTKNGYQQLDDWEGSGIGDLVIGAKWRAYSNPLFSAAFTSGVVLPTGNRDNPSILNDYRMGDGQFDVFQAAVIDKRLTKDWLVSAHAKYTYQAPGKKSLRHESETTLFSPTISTSRFKLGDKVEFGASTGYSTKFGVNLKTGILANFKNKDAYKNLPKDVEIHYEKDTRSKSYVWENALGYSSVEAYRRKEISIPFSMQLGFKKHLSSKNSPVSDQISLDLAVFF